MEQKMEKNIERKVREDSCVVWLDGKVDERAKIMKMNGRKGGKRETEEGGKRGRKREKERKKGITEEREKAAERTELGERMQGRGESDERRE